MTSEFITWNTDLISKQYGTNDFEYFGGTYCTFDLYDL